MPGVPGSVVAGILGIVGIHRPSSVAFRADTPSTVENTQTSPISSPVQLFKTSDESMTVKINA